MGPNSLRGHAFHSNQNLLQTQKESNGVLRNISDQGTFISWFMAIEPRAKFNYYSRSDTELHNSSINWHSNLVHIHIWEVYFGLIWVGFILSYSLFWHSLKSRAHFTVSSRLCCSFSIPGTWLLGGGKSPIFLTASYHKPKYCVDLMQDVLQ